MTSHSATKHVATVVWERRRSVETDSSYSRSHHWYFDGGTVVPASSSPQVVPVPMSDPTGVDPEEAFVASLSSCHTLWFLSIAARRGFVVENYRDNAEGILEKNDDGRLAITVVTLRPNVVFARNKVPSAEEIHQFHDEAHKECFIANSVKSDVRCLPVI